MMFFSEIHSIFTTGEKKNWNIRGTIPILIIALYRFKFTIAATTFMLAKMFSGYLKEIPG